MADTLYSIEDVLKRLPFSRAKVYQLLKTGELKGVKIGTRRFIKESQINEFIAGLTDAA